VAGKDAREVAGDDGRKDEGVENGVKINFLKLLFL
jgi:hypothetical protein